MVDGLVYESDGELLRAKATSISSCVRFFDRRNDNLFSVGEDATLGSCKKEIAEATMSSRIAMIDAQSSTNIHVRLK